MLRPLLNLLLPPQCAICDAQVSDPGQLCAGCFRQLHFIAAPACRRCGLPISAQRHQFCATCAATPPPWRQASAPFLYDDAAKRLILPFKHGREDIAPTLALHMHRAGAALMAAADVMVPVPLHRWRLLRRRYNQAALLAHALARRTRLPVLPDALERTRPTTSLGGLRAGERAALLRGAIRVRPSRAATIAGRRILLIDDVLTSGATASACTHALLDAGAANVDVLVASRVANPKGDAIPKANPHGTDDADD